MLRDEILKKKINKKRLKKTKKIAINRMRIKFDKKKNQISMDDIEKINSIKKRIKNSN